MCCLQETHFKERKKKKAADGKRYNEKHKRTGMGISTPDAMDLREVIH